MVFNVDSCLSHRKYMKNKKRLSSDFYVAGQNRKRTFSVLEDDATCVSKYVYVYIYMLMCSYFLVVICVADVVFYFSCRSQIVFTFSSIFTQTKSLDTDMFEKEEIQFLAAI